MSRTTTTDSGEKPLADDFSEIAKTLNRLHDKEKLSWRKIARRPEYSQVAPGTLCSIAGGWEPAGNRLRDLFGVALIFDEKTQVKQGVRVCQCGRSFIPNAWNRKYCYICSPIGGKK